MNSRQVLAVFFSQGVLDTSILASPFTSTLRYLLGERRTSRWRVSKTSNDDHIQAIITRLRHLMPFHIPSFPCGTRPIRCIPGYGWRLEVPLHAAGRDLLASSSSSWRSLAISLLSKTDNPSSKGDSYTKTTLTRYGNRSESGMHLALVLATTVSLASLAITVPTTISTFPPQDETVETTLAAVHVPGTSPFFYIGNPTHHLFNIAALNMIPNPCVLCASPSPPK